MSEQRKPEFHLKANFPYEEVKKIILEFADELKRKNESIGVVPYPGKQDPAEMVMDRIATTWMNDDPAKTIETERWAAKQYFTLLLIDHCRLGYFRDHGMCHPQPDEKK